jgi:hypothetical protein
VSISEVLYRRRTQCDNLLTVFSLADNFLNRGYIFGNPDGISQFSTDFNLSRDVRSGNFRWYFSFLFNTWVTLGYCPECVSLAGSGFVPSVLEDYYTDTTVEISYSGYDAVYKVNKGWLAGVLITALLLVGVGAISIIIESMTVAPDTLGYISTAARNSKYIELPPTSSDMSGPERTLKIGSTPVMMQEVKAKAGFAKIVLGNKHDDAVPLKPGRLYR